MLDLIYTVLMRDIIVPHMQAAATQLLLAAHNGDIATVRRLVSEGRVDVNVTDEVCVQSMVLLNVNGGHTLFGYSIQSLSWSHAACNTLQWKEFSILPKHINIYHVITKVIHYSVIMHNMGCPQADILYALLCYIMLISCRNTWHNAICCPPWDSEISSFVNLPCHGR